MSRTNSYIYATGGRWRVRRTIGSRLAVVAAVALTLALLLAALPVAVGATGMPDRDPLTSSTATRAEGDGRTIAP